jgi:hypothetical protein
LIPGPRIGGGYIDGRLALRGTRETIDSQRRLVEVTIRHEREMAHEQRAQDRRGDTYLELVRFLHLVGYYAQQHLDGALHGVDPPSQESINEMLAKLMTFGSDEVVGKFMPLPVVREGSNLRAPTRGRALVDVDDRPSV